MDLDVAGVSASAGSPCADSARAPSRVLEAVGCAPDEIDGALCFTLGRWTAPAEIEAALERLPAIIAGRRGHARHASG
jgi:cysteine desulfurase